MKSAKRESRKCFDQISLRRALHHLGQLLCLVLDSRSQILVDPAEHLVCPLSRWLVRCAQMSSYIVDEVILLSRCASEDLPQSSGLDEIFVRDL